MPTILFVYHSKNAGLCFWMTSDASQEDVGYSSAGLTSITEIIEEIGDLSDTDTVVVDITSLDNDLSDAIMSLPESRQAAIQERGKPIDNWLENR